MRAAAVMSSTGKAPLCSCTTVLPHVRSVDESIIRHQVNGGPQSPQSPSQGSLAPTAYRALTQPITAYRRIDKRHRREHLRSAPPTRSRLCFTRWSGGVRKRDSPPSASRHAALINAHGACKCLTAATSSHCLRKLTTGACTKAAGVRRFLPTYASTVSRYPLRLCDRCHAARPFLLQARSNAWAHHPSAPA